MEWYLAHLDTLVATTTCWKRRKQWPDQGVATVADLAGGLDS